MPLAGRAWAICTVLCSIAVTLGLLCVASLTARASEAAERMTFYTDDDNGVYFSAEGGAVAYCMDPDVHGPGKAGTTYTRLERATGVIGYIAYHGYPNNLTIGGVALPNTEIGIRTARVVTNMAIWTYQRDHSRNTVTDCATDSMNRASTKLLTDAKAWAESSANTASAPENNSTWIYSPPSGSGKQRMLLPGEAEKAGSLALTKASTLPTLTKDSACYSLAGATYEVFSDKDLTRKVGTLTTKEDGTTNVLEGLSEGTYYAKETKAPQGFALSSTVYSAEVKAGTTSVISATDEPLFCRAEALVQKVDAETGQAAPQGDASLAGAEFTVTYWDNLDGSTSGTPLRSWVMRTDSTGKVLLDEAHLVSGDALYVDASGKPVLPIGTIAITETVAPEGYHIANEATQIQVLKGDGKSSAQAFVTATFEEHVRRGGIAVGKISRETAGYLQQGASSLEGATFSITLLSPGSVVVDGETYTTGQTVTSITSAWDGDICVARTAADALPYATYLIKETGTKPASGTLPNREWSQTVQIRDDSEWVDLTNVEDACPNQVARGDLSFVKRNSSTAEAMAGVPFALSSLTTGETHLIVTDENGMFDSSLSSHSLRTNASDAAMGTDGSIDESLLDPEAGLWFSGRDDLVTQTDDSLGALPYDRYLLRELPCAANEGMQLVEVSLAVRKDAHTLDWGTIDDQPTPKVTIATELLGATGTHETGNTVTTLTDTVFYDGLAAGEQYVFVGTLHLRLPDGTDGGPITSSDGSTCTQEHAFTARSESGYEQLDFAVDATALAGQTVVCFEELYASGADEEPIASHADIESSSQSVSVVGLETTATDGEGSKEVSTLQTATVVDHVAYTGLTAGERYTVTGSLHLRGQDGSDLGPLCDEQGVAVAAMQEFVAEDSDGEVDVTFSFDASQLCGCTLVAFEQLCDAQGTPLASHEDISDEAQSVYVPALLTEARDAETGTRTAPAEGKRTIVDTVSYRNLTPGATYVLTATLHGKAEDGTDQGALTTSDGKEVSAQQTFTCEQPDGQTEIAVEVDSAQITSPAVVVFEELTLESSGETVASHRDISSASQTVSFPRVSTSLTDASDGDHTIGEGKVKVVDEVTYQGLVAGTEYRVEGTLHMRAKDGSDAGAVKDAAGKAVTASETFVPETSDGKVSLTFSFDSTLLGGNPAVAFEVVRQGEARIAAHEDISSQSQTVTPSPEPVQPAATPQRDEPVTRMPQTGRLPVGHLLAGGGCVAAAIGLASLGRQRRHTQSGPRPHRRRHYVR